MSAPLRSSWLAPQVARAPEAPALLAEGRSRSFAELQDRALRAAGLLRERGVEAGDVVAVLISDGFAFSEWLHGVERCGATLLPLHLRLGEAELAFQLGDAQPRCLVHDAALAERACAASRAMVLARIGSSEHAAAAPLVQGPASTAPLALLYTSGTTGRPKAVELGAESFLAGAQASALHLGSQPGDRWLACLPLYHVGGLAILLRSALAGTPVLLQPGFDPEALSRAVDEQGATLLSLVPTMLARWLDARGGRPVPASLRAVLIGGAAAPEALLERARAEGIPVLPTYGLTEAGSQVATRRPGDGAPPWAGRLRPLSGNRLRIQREDGSEAEVGEAGEIQVAGPTLMRGYRGQPEASRAALAGGWLRTGDVGVLDADGGLQVLDRRDDLLVSGGENVYPAEIEAVLLQHPGVAEAGVSARPDADYGARPVAWIVPAGEAPSAAELLRLCRQQLAGYKVPVAFESVEALPRNALGKLLRRELGRPRAASTRPSASAGEARPRGDSSPLA